MTKVPMSHDSLRRSRRRYLALSVAIAICMGALIAVLALPAIERVIWPDVMQGSAH